MVAPITSLVVPGSQQHFGAKVVAHILSFTVEAFADGPNRGITNMLR